MDRCPAAPVHPPKPPPMPVVVDGSLLIEALCQAAACFNSLAFAARPEAELPQQHHGYLVAIRDFKFPAFVYVGETLTLEVAQREMLGQVIAFAVRATVAAVRSSGSTSYSSRLTAGTRYCVERPTISLDSASDGPSTRSRSPRRRRRPWHRQPGCPACQRCTAGGTPGPQ